MRFERVPSGKIPSAFLLFKMLAALANASSSSRLPVRLDLAGRTHDKSRHRIAEVPVFCEVVRRPACGSDDGDRGRHATSDWPPGWLHHRSGCVLRRGFAIAGTVGGRGEKHLQCAVYGCGREGLRTGLNDPVRLEGIPCRFKFASFVHNHHFRVEALMFIHQGEAMRPVFAGQG